MGVFGRFELGQSERLLNFRTCHNITKYKIVEALRRMTMGKEISEIVYFRACHNTTKYKIVEALRRMTTGKEISEIENRRRLVQIVYPMEIWKCLSEGLNWLTRFFNVIFKTPNMPEEWRSSIIIPLYKARVISKLQQL